MIDKGPVKLDYERYRTAKKVTEDMVIDFLNSEEVAPCRKSANKDINPTTELSDILRPDQWPIQIGSAFSYRLAAAFNIGFGVDMIKGCDGKVCATVRELTDCINYICSYQH